MNVCPTPAPWSVIALEIAKLLPHAQLPAGTTTISPSTAALTLAFTSLYEQEAAVRVAAAAGAAQTISAMPRALTATATATAPAVLTTLILHLQTTLLQHCVRICGTHWPALAKTGPRRRPHSSGISRATTRSQLRPVKS